MAARYDVGAVLRTIRPLIGSRERARVELPVYDRGTRAMYELRLHMSIAPDDLLIVEGVPTLLVDALAQLSDIRVHLEMPSPSASPGCAPAIASAERRRWPSTRCSRRAGRTKLRRYRTRARGRSSSWRPGRTHDRQHDAAAYGGLNLIRFHPDNSVSVDPVICEPAVLAHLEASTLVFYTGRVRSASPILAEQSEGMPVNRALMRQMVQLAFNLKVELESGRWENIGPILDENWRLKRQMSDGISEPQINEWYRVAMANGALGGKLLGAGKGGFLMFFAAPDRHTRISRTLSDLKPVKFRFDRTGAQIVFYQPVDFP